MSATDEIAAKALYDLILAGAAMTAEETFGLQLALPDGSPRRRGVRAEWGVDAMLVKAAVEAFDRRWMDISSRLAIGGTA